MTSSEKSLLEGVRRLDAAALAEMYDIFSPALYAYAYRQVGSADLAEECVAETFSRMLTALQRGGGPGENLGAYLYRVAHNWITDQYRRRPEVISLEMQDDDPVLRGARLAGQDGDAQAGGDPHRQAEMRAQQLQVRHALSRLTPEQRQVVVLRYLEDFDLDEIAEMLGKPVGAIKALQHRALEALRRLLPAQELF